LTYVKPLEFFCEIIYYILYLFIHSVFCLTTGP
jgi:hypothetical protein